MREFHAGMNIGLAEIQAGEIAGVGGVLQPQVHGIGAGLERSLQGRQAASRGNEFHPDSFINDVKESRQRVVRRPCFGSRNGAPERFFSARVGKVKP
jgi:hypothetical protein